MDTKSTQKGRTRTLNCPPMVITQIDGSTRGQSQLLLQGPRDAGFRYETPAQKSIITANVE